MLVVLFWVMFRLVFSFDFDLVLELVRLYFIVWFAADLVLLLLVAGCYLRT